MITANQLRYFINVECLSAGEIAEILGVNKREVLAAAKKHAVKLVKGMPRGFVKGKKYGKG